MLRNNVNQHSIGSTPHNNGTYYIRRNVDTQTECNAIKVPELESKLVVHSSIIATYLGIAAERQDADAAAAVDIKAVDDVSHIVLHQEEVLLLDAPGGIEREDDVRIVFTRYGINNEICRHNDKGLGMDM